MQISFYFDPACPWCWMTSRWIIEAQKYRDIAVQWRPFSLEIKNAGLDVPAQYRPAMRLGLRALRIIEAARSELGADNESIGRFYSALGTSIHNDNLGAKASLPEALAAAQWSADLHYHENSEEFDSKIAESMNEAFRICGTENLGIPIVVLEGENPLPFFGPVLTPAPRGEAAATLWDTFVTLGTNKSFYELKKLQPRTADFG